MNTYLLGGLAVAGLLVLVGVLLLRRRPNAPARHDHRAALPIDTVAADAAVRPTPTPPDAASAPSVDAQRLAATEALRQARQRKAEEATRLQAERQAQAQADARRAQSLAQTPAPDRASTPAAASAATTPALPQRAQSPKAPAVMPSAEAHPLQMPQMPPASRSVERITPVLSPLAIHTTPTTHSTQPVAAAGLAPLRAPSRPAGPPTVLLADDSKVVRVKTSRLLEKQGWRVLLADDGLAALQLLDAEGADLLITDVEMPGLDGFELTRRVRAHPRWGRLPVIMITSSDDKHRAEANAAGVNLLMGKPYEEAALLAQARQLLGVAAGSTAPGLALH
jgi:CheY-like chemotaxis protein